MLNGHLIYCSSFVYANMRYDLKYQTNLLNGINRGLTRFFKIQGTTMLVFTF